MKPGDVVVHPARIDNTLNLGRIEGEYEWVPGATAHRSRRKVCWLKTGISRTTLSKGARYEIGAALTLFRVKTHEEEFQTLLAGTTSEVAAKPLSDVPLEAAVTAAEEEPNAERIETYTRDFILDTLLKELAGERFEHLVAHLLTAMGYRTRITQPTGDGGIDIIAHRDPLGLEPPIIKVQCKRTVGSIGAPDVQKLIGTLAPGGSEVGLFVTLGSYTQQAVHIGSTHQDVRLLNGPELVDLVFDHYEQLAPEWQRLLPMRRVYVVDREPEAT